MMQRDDNRAQPDNAAMGFRLSDMHQLGWEQALTEKQVILRLADPDEALLQTVSRRFGLDELHIRDIRNAQHPPNFNRLESGVIHIILRFPIETSDDNSIVEVSSVSILADSELCALIWPGKRYHLFRNEDLAGLTVEECVSKIIHMLVDHLLQRVYLLRDAMEEFEDECLGDAGNADLGRLLGMRKELSMLARYARNNAVAIGKLDADEAYGDSIRLADAHEHMLRATSIAESRAEHALNVMQAVQSLLSQRLNEVMKFLAVITVVLTPMGIIAGIFGMNFTRMDVLGYPHGFALSVWGMAVLGAALAVYFKIRRWW